MSDYRLHYAPDNASLVIRLALLQLGQPFETCLVDRATQGHKAPEYLKMNPNGLIPVLETPDGPIFETAAILLWLGDRHGALVPPPQSPQRASFLKWLFFASNTLHAGLRMNFYPQTYIGPDPDLQRALLRTTRENLVTHFGKLDALLDQGPTWFGASNPSALDFYVACFLRWAALYPAGDTKWFDLGRFANLQRLATGLESLDIVDRARTAEGLGQHPFSAPHPPNPPEGTVL